MKYLIASHLNNMNIFVNFRNMLLTVGDTQQILGLITSLH